MDRWMNVASQRQTKHEIIKFDGTPEVNQIILDSTRPLSDLGPRKNDVMLHMRPQIVRLELPID